MKFFVAVVGGRSVGTPALMEMAHRKCGHLNWSRLFDDAIALAEDGFNVSDRLAVCAGYRGYEVCGMGPPSPGARTVGQILKLIEGSDHATLGYKVNVRGLTSGLHAIAVTPDGLIGGADPRREGIALGN